jgi:hypothetical protein
MGKRRGPKPPRGGDKPKPPPGGDYAIGYCRPPRHTRFQPGQSGNPTGRRKGLRNLATDVRSTLTVPVRVNAGGRLRKISTQEAVLMRLRELALKGNARALDLLLEFAMRFNNEAVVTGAQLLSTNDQEILNAYRAEVAADIAASSPKPAPSPPTPRVRMIRRPDKEPA